MMLPKVSLIIPCYNAGKYISRMLDSIMAQKYTPFELILINDDSTDDTDAVIQHYIPLLEKNGIDVIYKTQVNQGLGATVDNGLKLFTGDYLCWADPDDYFEPGSFSDRVNFLETHPEYAIVTSDAYIRPAENLDKFEIMSVFYPNRHEPYQFTATLLEKSIYCSGCHMIRTSAFLTVNPNRSIYRSRAGQNWQMLLPVYYKFKRAFLEKPLYNYVVYQNSHSRGDSTLQKKLARIDGHEDIINKTLKMIEETQEVNLSNYYNISGSHFAGRRLAVCAEFKNKDGFYKTLKDKKHLYGLTFKDYISVLKLMLGPKISMFIYKMLHFKDIFK